MSLDQISTQVANKSLDAIWERESLISNNISNADTPNYKAKNIDFESQLSSALSDNTLTQSEVNSISPQETVSNDTVNDNGNNVDVEEQMVELTRNQLQYNYMSRSISNQLSMLSQAASEGRS